MPQNTNPGAGPTLMKAFLVLLVIAVVLLALNYNGYINMPSLNLNFNSNTANQKSFMFNGQFPAQKEVSYTTKAGESFVAQNAYPGFIYIFTDYLSYANVEKGILENNGKVAATISSAGIYLVQVKEGEEASFLSAMYKKSWVRSGIPASPPQIAIIPVYDYYSHTSNDKKDCIKDHGDITSIEAKRLGGSTENIDLNSLDGGKGQQINLVDNMRNRMQEAGKTGDNLVFSASLQSEESYDGCKGTDCSAVQNGQKEFFRSFLQMFDSEIKNNPEGTNHAMLVLAAGNAGADLSDAIGSLRSEYPEAFKHIVIVGGTDSKGNLYDKLNHIATNTDGIEHPGMVYSRGEDVRIDNGDSVAARCSGTSFATPEVAAVLDYIWGQAPSLTAEEVIKVFDQTLNELGKDNKIPQADGVTDKAFLDRASQLAKQMEKDKKAIDTSKIKGKTDQGLCSTDSECKILGIKCYGEGFDNFALCSATDHLCHCCKQLCVRDPSTGLDSDCKCMNCESCEGEWFCEKETCLYGLGGKTTGEYVKNPVFCASYPDRCALIKS